MDPARSETSHPFVLDTSLFVNPQIRRPFGASTGEAARRFLEEAGARGIDCFMSPAAFRELLGFLDSVSPAQKNALGRIIQRAPSLTVTVSGHLLAEWISDTRQRIDRGLRVAEKAVRLVGKGESVDAVLRRLRAEYRKTLREGTVDSAEDLELALLAVEIDGILLSADSGLRDFAARLGAKLKDPEQVAAQLGFAP